MLSRDDTVVVEQERLFSRDDTVVEQERLFSRDDTVVEQERLFSRDDTVVEQERLFSRDDTVVEQDHAFHSPRMQPEDKSAQETVNLSAFRNGSKEDSFRKLVDKRPTSSEFLDEVNNSENLLHSQRTVIEERGEEGAQESEDNEATNERDPQSEPDDLPHSSIRNSNHLTKAYEELHVQSGKEKLEGGAPLTLPKPDGKPQPSRHAPLSKSKPTLPFKEQYAKPTGDARGNFQSKSPAEDALPLADSHPSSSLRSAVEQDHKKQEVTPTQSKSKEATNKSEEAQGTRSQSESSAAVRPWSEPQEKEKQGCPRKLPSAIRGGDSHTPPVIESAPNPLLADQSCYNDGVILKYLTDDGDTVSSSPKSSSQPQPFVAPYNCQPLYQAPSLIQHSIRLIPPTPSTCEPVILSMEEITKCPECLCDWSGHPVLIKPHNMEVLPLLQLCHSYYGEVQLCAGKAVAVKEMCLSHSDLLRVVAAVFQVARDTGTVCPILGLLPLGVETSLMVFQLPHLESCAALRVALTQEPVLVLDIVWRLCRVLLECYSKGFAFNLQLMKVSSISNTLDPPSVWLRQSLKVSDIPDLVLTPHHPFLFSSTAQALWNDVIHEECSTVNQLMSDAHMAWRTGNELFEREHELMGVASEVNSIHHILSCLDEMREGLRRSYSLSPEGV